MPVSGSVCLPRKHPIDLFTEIETLYQICVAASTSTGSIFAALFAEYHVYFEQNGMDTSRDNTVFRWLFPVGDSARRDKNAGQSVDLVRHLRSVLAAQGIETVLSNDEDDDVDDDTRSLKVSHTSSPAKAKTRSERRVSFDDARLEETWLSEHSQFARSPPTPAHNGLLRQPPRRGRDSVMGQRARSTSSSHRLHSRLPAPKHAQEASPSSQDNSEFEEPRNPTLLFEVSQTQLEQNADAFFATTELKTARRYLHIWHDQTLALQSEHAQAWAFASNHDRRKLLRESLDALVGVLVARKEERQRTLGAERAEHEARAQEQQRIAELERRINACLGQKHKDILFKAFSHWIESARYQKQVTECARRQVLLVRYFKRWRRITQENAVKARSLLEKKYLRLWRTKTARRALVHEQADAHYEEGLMKRCLQRWFWSFCDRRVEGWHDQRLERAAFAAWVTQLQTCRAQEDQAAQFQGRTLGRSCLRTLVRRRNERQSAAQLATTHRNQTLLGDSFKSLRIIAKLTPREKTVSSKLDLDLKRKVLKVWQFHLNLNRQAAEVDRKRLLQSAWTSWNEALRCKALGQRIDERVLLETLYKWVLQARLQSLQRTKNARLVRRVLSDWNGKLQTKETALDHAAITFAANQRRRQLSYGMVQLNLALRVREDAERAAIEFSNSRALPHVLDTWKDRTDHARMLAKWAADARFYCLTTRTLRVWQEATEEHKHQRRRDAYMQVRARIKVCLVRRCFTRLQLRASAIATLREHAESRAQAKCFAIGMDAFDTIRDQTAHHAELDVQACAMDRQKLLGSALSALVNQRTDLIAMDRQAGLQSQESELALVAGALKRVQWATFTAARRIESADALWARNRDQHIRNMLRHWMLQASARKAARADLPPRDPESPSLRPASRAAARSAERPAFASSPPVATGTPGYMRTPSRSRKVGRFRPLPTPAHVTPMTFEQSYYLNTPATPAEGEFGEEADVFEGLIPQITPFARKLRAGGVSNTPAQPPPSALRTSMFGRSIVGGGTAKSVRFAGSSRFGRRGTTDEST